jgi:ATP-dependent RNA helicase HelY
LREAKSFVDLMGGGSEGLWISFKRHLRFLRETHFVDEKDRLTVDGEWASKLRVDQPLLIAEAIRRGRFAGLSPELMAGCIAPFVWDRDQEVEVRGYPQDTEIMDAAFGRIAESIEGIRRLKVKRGFENPLIPSWPATALYLWASGAAWEELTGSFSVEEGDMASLIMRTADHLRQVVNLRDTHPALSDVAEKVIGQILREPVLIP